MIEHLRNVNVVLQTILLAAFVILLWRIWRKHGHERALSLLTNTSPSI